MRGLSNPNLYPKALRKNTDMARLPICLRVRDGNEMFDRSSNNRRTERLSWRRGDTKMITFIAGFILGMLTTFVVAVIVTHEDNR